MYFTEYHWIAVATFLIIAILIIGISIKKLDIKSSIFVSIFTLILSTFGAISVVYTIDEFTKEAKLLQIQHSKIRSQEAYLIRGIVKNVGTHKIKKCTLEVTMSDKGANRLEHGVFKPMAWFSDLFEAKPVDPIFISKDIIIATDLLPNESRGFRVTLPYPTFMKSIELKYKLTQH